MIDGERIARSLSAGGVDASVHVAHSTASTNDDAKLAAAEGQRAPAVFLAELQTAGRGRGGSAWLAGAGESILMSILLRPPVSPRESARLTLAVGAAVSDVLEALLPGRVRVKWPNDVWVDERKIAGILVEGQTRGQDLSSIVVGVGLNVSALVLPAEIASSATSLTLAGASVDRATLAADLALAIVRAVDRFVEGGLAPFLAVLRARDALLGHEIEVGDVIGVASGIDDEGRLLSRTQDGALVPIVAGHVVFGPKVQGSEL